MFGVTNVGNEGFGYKFFEVNNPDKNLSGWNHIVIILDNENEIAYLYLNGGFEAKLNKVVSLFDI